MSIATPAAKFDTATEQWQPRFSLVSRLIAAREDQAKQRIRKHFSAISDERLAGFGFSQADIQAIRSDGYAGPPR